MIDVFDMAFLGIFGTALYLCFAKRSVSGPPARPNFAPGAPSFDHTTPAVNVDGTPMLPGGSIDISGNPFGITD